MSRSLGRVRDFSDGRNKMRASSVDCRSRGSFVPNKPRSSSEDRSRSSLNIPRSSYGRNSSITPMDGKRLKDVRPLHDKGFQRERFDELLEFLEQNCASVKPPRNALPSKKDFEAMFAFLYNYWDPQYVVRRLEDEAPKILKNLGYPFPLNKSAFVLITRTNWPILLGILLWMMGVNKFIMALNPDLIFTSGNTEKPKEQSIRLKYIFQTYQSEFDDDEKDKEVFSDIIKSRYADNVNMEENYADLKNKLEQIEEELSNFNELKAKSKEMEVMKRNYLDYFNKMQNHQRRKKENFEELQRKFDEKESELAALQSRIDEKQAVYDAQGFDGQKQLEYFSTQKKELVSKLDEKNRKFKSLQDKLWGVEIEITQLLDKGTTVTDEFNEMYLNIRQTASKVLSQIKNSSFTKSAADHKFTLPDYKMTFSLPSYDMWTNSVKPVLEETSKEIKNSKDRLGNELSNKSQKLHEVQVKKSELKMKNKLLKMQLLQKQNELALKEQQDLDDIAIIEARCEQSQKTLERLHEERSQINQSCNDLKKKLLESECLEKAKSCELEECIKLSKVLYAEYSRIQDNVKQVAEAYKARMKEKMETFFEALSNDDF